LFVQSYACHLDLLSFPTRRSSDLAYELTVLPRTAQRKVVFPFNLDLSLVLRNLDQRGSGNLFSKAGKAIDGVNTDTAAADNKGRSEEHTSELQSRENLVCRLLLEK